MCFWATASSSAAGLLLGVSTLATKSARRPFERAKNVLLEQVSAFTGIDGMGIALSGSLALACINAPIDGAAA